jgi:hypothetical protein
MTKKRRSGKTKTSAGGRGGKRASVPSEEARPVADRRTLEKVTSDLTRLLDEQSFETIEEANEFISQFVGTKDLPSSERELTLWSARRTRSMRLGRHAAANPASGWRARRRMRSSCGGSWGTEGQSVCSKS